MKHTFTKIILLTAVVAGLTTACTPAGENIPTGKRYEFNNILDITYTPDTLTRCGGWFTDAGSWMGLNSYLLPVGVFSPAGVQAVVRPATTAVRRMILVNLYFMSFRYYFKTISYALFQRHRLDCSKVAW